MSDQDSTTATGVVIRSRDGRVLFTSNAATVREALQEALAAGVNLRYSDLSGSDLSYSNLSGSDLRYSNLSGSDLSYSDLSGSDLSYSDLSGSDLSGSDLSYSNLSGSDLRYSNLRDSDLSGSTTCLSITGLPSGHAILAPLPEGWRLTIGCWSGTVAELRELIAQDDDWPEATGEQITLRRPMLAALADMCDAWSATKASVLEEIQSKWAVTTDA